MKLHTAKVTYCTVAGRAAWWCKISKDLDSHPGCATYKLCDLGKVNLPFWTCFETTSLSPYKIEIISCLQSSGFRKVSSLFQGHITYEHIIPPTTTHTQTHTGIFEGYIENSKQTNSLAYQLIQSRLSIPRDLWIGDHNFVQQIGIWHWENHLMSQGLCFLIGKNEELGPEFFLFLLAQISYESITGHL